MVFLNPEFQKNKKRLAEIAASIDKLESRRAQINKRFMERLIVLRNEQDKLTREQNQIVQNLIKNKHCGIQN